MRIGIEGKPYQAEIEWLFVKKLPDGRIENTTRTGTVARDSRGRRAEHHYPFQPKGDQRRLIVPDNIFDPAQPFRIVDVEPFRLASIYDPVARTWHVFEAQSGKTLMCLPITVRTDKSGLEIPSVEIQGTSVPMSVLWFAPQTGDRIIGHKVIEGMDCSGYCREGNDWKIEFWVAEDLQETILIRLDHDGQEFIFRMHSIRRSEPDSQLFAAPSLDPQPDNVDIFLRPFNE